MLRKALVQIKQAVFCLRLIILELIFFYNFDSGNLLHKHVYPTSSHKKPNMTAHNWLAKESLSGVTIELHFTDNLFITL